MSCGDTFMHWYQVAFQGQNLLIQALMLKLRDIQEHTDHLLNYSWPLLCPLNHTLNYKENAVIYMDITWGTEGFDMTAFNTSI